MLLGATLVSLAALLALVGHVRRSGAAGSVWRPLFFLVAPWCCVLASPYGTDVIAYYRLLLVDSPVPKYITEWQAPGSHGYFLIFFAVAAATLVIAVWQRRRLSTLRPTRAGADPGGGASERPRRRLVLAGAGDAAAARARRHRATAAHRHPSTGGSDTFSPAPWRCLVAGTALFALTRSNEWYEQDMSARGARAAARAAAASDTRAAVWASGRYGNWLLWKEPSLHGRVAWDVRFELLTEAELRSIVRFNSDKPGWRAATRGYPILVLDRSKSADQVRALRSEPGTAVLFADDSVVVLTRNPLASAESE